MQMMPLRVRVVESRAPSCTAEEMAEPGLEPIPGGGSKALSTPKWDGVKRTQQEPRSAQRDVPCQQPAPQMAPVIHRAKTSLLRDAAISAFRGALQGAEAFSARTVVWGRQVGGEGKPPGAGFAISPARFHCLKPSLLFPRVLMEPSPPQETVPASTAWYTSKR